MFQGRTKQGMKAKKVRECLRRCYDPICVLRGQDCVVPSQLAQTNQFPKGGGGGRVIYTHNRLRREVLMSFIRIHRMHTSCAWRSIGETNSFKYMNGVHNLLGSSENVNMIWYQLLTYVLPFLKRI